MKKPAIPTNEIARLKSLRSLHVLDTPPEERYDRLTRLAKHLFKVPVAMVSLVDENRQWLKSCIGTLTGQISRDISFCGHAILDEAIFIIEDASKDPRFADNPLVTGEPYIRFYAGYPLRYTGDNILGTLCVIDTKPRKASADDFQALKDLAQLTEHELMAVHLATMDELCQISNRRGFISLAEKSLQICARQKIPVELYYFDLNQFKVINDKYGHAEGDRVLSDFANILKQTFRDSDVVARMGGDEFAVLITDTSIEPGEAVLQRLRWAVKKYNHQADHDFSLSFSVGSVTACKAKQYDLGALLRKADSEMYENKNAKKCS